MLVRKNQRRPQQHRRQLRRAKPRTRHSSRLQRLGVHQRRIASSEGNPARSRKQTHAYRERAGSLDIPLESKGALESLTSIETKSPCSKPKKQAWRNCTTPGHPSHKAVLDKLAVLGTRQSKINQQIAGLPQRPTGSHPPDPRRRNQPSDLRPTLGETTRTQHHESQRARQCPSR